MLDLLIYSIMLPIIGGFICFILPGKIKYIHEIISLIITLITGWLTFHLFINRPVGWIKNGILFFRVDNLSSFIVLAIGLFGILISLYSIKFMPGRKLLNQYYGYLLLTLAAAIGAVLANDLRILLVLWGFLGLTLYMLINLGGHRASDAAKKTLVIIGGSDALLLLGIGIVWYLTSSFQINKINLALSGSLPIFAFLCLALASFAKVGAMPFHTWIPDMADTAPTPATAFLPASLDKLLGIYLIGRIVMNLFVMEQALGLLLMIVGSVTIVASVMMALVQTDMRRLIAYLNISAAGYMLIALATGNPVGIAGGFFYLLSTSIWTSCLFLCSGAVETKLKTTEFVKLGGLAKAMPVTFVSCLIAGLSISGVPPFNGFFSKWMVYQGLIELGKQGHRLWVIWLVAAMFGSALTLASFMKLIHTTFLGQRSEVRGQKSEIEEVSWMMWLPMVILAGFCVIFGIFAFQIPLKYFINPAVGKIVSISGVWMPSLATGLILIGIAAGFIIFFLFNFLKIVRTDTTYVGGEVIEPEARVTGVEFYNTIKDFKILKAIYKKAEQKFFDIYDQGGRFIFFFTRLLRRLHTGLLPSYLYWSMLGLVILFFILLRG